MKRGRPFLLDIFRPHATISSNSPGRGGRSAPPAGTHPRGEDREIVLPRGDDDRGAAGGDRLQILFVEDDVRFVELVRHILADAGTWAMPARCIFGIWPCICLCGRRTTSAACGHHSRTSL